MSLMMVDLQQNSFPLKYITYCTIGQWSFISRQFFLLFAFLMHSHNLIIH